MKTRVVHYAAHGSGGYATACYHAHLGTHLDSATKLPDDVRPGHYTLGKTLYSVPLPRRSTDLTKVTCDACWREVVALARRHFQMAWPTVIAS